ncbi:MAG: aldose 1-epimerase family protein [Chloroflexota bacterium]
MTQNSRLTTHNSKLTTPSGAQYELSSDRLSAVVVEVGGGLRAFGPSDLPVLDGYTLHEMCHDARGQLLMPWPNRLADGRYRFEGQDYQLPLTEPSLGNAIHGLVRWKEWTAAGKGSAVTMTHRLYPSPGYPFTINLSARYELDGDGLRVTLGAENVGSEPCPFGAGQHPYVRAGVAPINSNILSVPAESMYRYDDRLIPIERVPVVGLHDFRQSRLIGDTVINTDYTDLRRGDDGKAVISLQAPDTGLTVEVWMDKAFKHVTLYTGETVRPASRRRQSLAIEPMTCPPNAFVTGEDLIVLHPQQSWQGTWGISLRS